MLLVPQPDFDKQGFKAYSACARGSERLPEDRAQRLPQRPFWVNTLPFGVGASVLPGIWLGVGVRCLSRAAENRAKEGMKVTSGRAGEA